ncbi:MAG: ACP S-malonyltransferase [Acidimicrobiaceae bacterium]|nr:ACP S-malonyltransferase [Acidimicrobiaceae bacterium]
MGAPWQDHPSWRVVSTISDATGRDVGALLVEADAETLRATRNAQLAAFSLSMVILDAARAAGLSGEGAVAGHSLGEYSALVAAGAASLEEGARLVAARGDAMQAAADAAPGTMAAVLGLEPEEVARVCGKVEGAWLANDNAPGQVVLAGTAAGVAAAGEAALALGAKRVLPLVVGGAFHSPLMAAAQERLDAALAAASFGPSRIPLVANVDAAAHSEGWADLLSAQLVSRVRWRESLLTLARMGATRFVELGPGTEMSGMVRRTVEGASRSNVATPDDLGGLLA